MSAPNPKPRGRPAVITGKRAIRLQFPCRTCGAQAGQVCRSPSGASVSIEHADRFAQAAAAHPEASTP